MFTRYALGRMRANSLCADQVDSLRAQHGIDRDEVGFLQEIVQAAVFDTERGFPRFVQSATLCVEDAHAKTSGASRYGFADGAESDDSQGFAVDFTADEMERLAAGKNPRPESAIAFHDSARHGHKKRPMEICRGFSNERRNVCHGYAPRARRRHIDSRWRDRHRGDQLEIGTGVDNFSIHAIVEHTDEIVIWLECRNQLGLGDDVGRIRVQFKFSNLPKAGQCVFQDWLCKKDLAPLLGYPCLGRSFETLISGCGDHITYNSEREVQGD